jgi:N-acetylmuramoyl-L-alanine amidase
MRKIIYVAIVIGSLACGNKNKLPATMLPPIKISDSTTVPAPQTLAMQLQESQQGYITNPYATTNKMHKKTMDSVLRVVGQYPLIDSSNYAFVGTTNFNARRPSMVIIHHTAQNSCEQTLRTFTVLHSQVSAHYVICRNGSVVHMLNDYMRAWHGGNSRWGTVTDINSTSIGIELDNNGSEPFPKEQINALLQLLSRLKNQYAIPQNNFIGHSDIAPTRKNDPSRYFPWKTLAQQGYGMWYNDSTEVAVPNNFNTTDAMKIVGYDMRNERAAIKAFKLHFNNADTTSVMDTKSKKILYSLYQKL